MSDEPTEQVEETQSVPETTSEQSPPWGEDFEPGRAWQTISHLREREKELEPAARALQHLASGEDQETFRELAEAYGFEIEEDQPDEYEEYDPYEPRLEALESEIAGQRNERAIDEFEAHLQRLVKDDDIELSNVEKEYIFTNSLTNGFTYETTESAFKQLSDWLQERDKSTVERYLKSKKAPHVSSVGKSATHTPSLDTPQQIADYMSQRLQES